MLSFPAGPVDPPVTDQASESSRAEVESPSEGEIEGFFGLLSDLGFTDDPQGPSAEDGMGNGALVLPVTLQGGQILPDQVAAEPRLLPPDSASQTPAVAAKQALVVAVRSLLTPDEAGAPEAAGSAFAGTPDTGAGEQSGAPRPLLGAHAAPEPSLRAAMGMETISRLQSLATAGDQVASPANAGGQGPATVNAEQTPAVRLPPVNVPVGARGWNQAIGERVTWMVGNGVHQAEVRLSPPHLGPIEIRVSLHNDQTSVSFSAHHALTREAIEAAVPRLRDMMADASLNLANVSVEQGGAGYKHASGYSGEGNSGAAYPETDASDDPVMETQGLSSRTSGMNLVDDYA